MRSRLKSAMLLAAVFLPAAAPAEAPRVLVTMPVDGAAQVPVDVGEIRIFFSTPMDTAGWSLRPLDGHEFPPAAVTGPPWQDSQTFVLQLNDLRGGTGYGLQLVGGAEQGFRSADGTPLPPQPIRFETAARTSGDDRREDAGEGGTDTGRRDETEPTERQPVDKPLTDEEQVALHIMGGNLGIFFHELGHGLIDMYKLPITGREEDTVDEFATMLLLYAREEGADLIPEVVWGFADLWRLIGKSGNKTPWWDEHTDSMVRFGNVLCLLYGSSPQEFQGLIDKYMQDQERRQYFCRQEYPEKIAAWETLLKDHLTVNGARPNGRATVVYGETRSEFGRGYQQTLQEEQIFESLAEGISAGFALPYDIQIVPKDCGEPNAFWDGEKRQIIMCHEMVQLFADLLQKEYAGDGDGDGDGGDQRPRPEPSNDARVVGQWGTQIENQGITFTWGLVLDAQGRYEFLHEQWRMGMRYYTEDQSGKYTADGDTVTFYPQQGGQIGGQTSYRYTVQNDMLTIENVPGLQGADLLLHALQ